jgi:aspartate racemase
VLGGMGPLATADFVRKLMELTPAENDDDHIPLIVSSCPQIPPRGPAVLGNGESPLPALLERVRFLEEAGARCIAMPCNTAHYWYGDMAEDISVPFIHIADAVCAELERRQIPAGLVGLIGTPATHHAGFYQERLAPRGYDCLLPDDDIMATAVLPGIAEVKKNNLAAAERLMRRAVEALLEGGASMVILGCTELPVGLAGAGDWTRKRCLDGNAALAQAAVDWALAARDEA